MTVTCICVCHVHSIPDVWIKVGLPTLVVVPIAGIIPVPLVQPVHMNWVETPNKTGDPVM